MSDVALDARATAKVVVAVLARLPHAGAKNSRVQPRLARLVLALMCAARARLTVVVEHQLLARAALDARGRHGRRAWRFCESQLESREQGREQRWARWTRDARRAIMTRRNLTSNM